MTSDHFLMIQVVECFIFYRLIQIDTDRFMWVQRFPDIPHISKYILNKILRNRLRACKSPAEIAEQIVVGQEKIFKRILIPLPYGLHTLFFVMLILVFHIVLSLCSERLYTKPVLPCCIALVLPKYLLRHLIPTLDLICLIVIFVN